MFKQLVFNKFSGSVWWVVPLRWRSPPAGPTMEEGARFLQAQLAKIVIKAEPFDHELSRLAPLPPVASRSEIPSEFRFPWSPKIFRYHAPPMQRRNGLDQVDGNNARV